MKQIYLSLVTLVLTACSIDHSEEKPLDGKDTIAEKQIITDSSDTSKKMTEEKMKMLLAQMNLNKQLTQQEKIKIQNAAFTDISGSTISVSSFKGKIIILDFWETWCKPCLAGMKIMEKVKKEYPDDVVIFAVNGQTTDTKEKIMAFAERNNYPFIFALGKELASELQVNSIPFKVVLDKNGDVIDTQTGFDDEGDNEYLYYRKIIEKNK